VPSPARLEQLASARREFEAHRAGKSDLLRLLDDSERPDSVYNSNAIENSTLTLEETERILLAVEISRHMDLREVHEAQNLARVSDYIRTHHSEPLDLERIATLHRMLLGNIDERIAGRFRGPGEYVRVGPHIAPPPEQVEAMLSTLLVEYEAGVDGRASQRIARLHLEFERIHPFNDGNGRIGRVIINYALYRLGFPPVIVRSRGKERYYAMLRAYDDRRDTNPFEDHLISLMLESLHRRIAYLRGVEIRPAADHAKRIGMPTNTLLNQARRQIIPAFRERGTWKIPADYGATP
jgi:Fic family protein